MTETTLDGRGKQEMQTGALKSRFRPKPVTRRELAFSQNQAPRNSQSACHNACLDLGARCTTSCCSARCTGSTARGGPSWLRIGTSILGQLPKRWVKSPRSSGAKRVGFILKGGISVGINLRLALLVSVEPRRMRHNKQTTASERDTTYREEGALKGANAD